MSIPDKTGAAVADTICVLAQERAQQVFEVCRFDRSARMLAQEWAHRPVFLSQDGRYSREHDLWLQAHAHVCEDPYILAAKTDGCLACVPAT